MKTWPVQHGMARFSEMLNACEAEGPQIVTMRDVDAAVLVPIEQWRKLVESRQPTLKELLLTDFAPGNMNIPPRGSANRRPNPFTNL